MNRALVLITILSSLVVPAEAQDPTVAVVPQADLTWVNRPLDREIPDAVEGIRRVRQWLDADRVVIVAREMPDDVKKTILKALDSQIEAVDGLLSRLQKTAEIQDEITKTNERIETLNKSRAQFVEEAGREPVVDGEAELTALQESANGLRSRVDALSQQLERVKLEDLPNAKAAVRDRAEQIANLETNLETLRKDRIASEGEARRLQAEASNDLRVMLAVESALAMRLGEARLRAQIEFSKRRAERLLGLRVDENEARLGALESEVRVGRRLLEAMSGILEERRQQELRTQQARKDHWEALKKTASAELVPFIEIRIVEFKAREELQDWRRKESEWQDRLGNGGTIGQTRAESEDLRDKITKDALDASSGILPDTTRELSEVVNDSRGRQKVLADAQLEFRAFEAKLRKETRDAQKALREILDVIDRAREKQRSLAGDPPSATVWTDEEWEQAGTDVHQAVKSRAEQLDRIRAELRTKAVYLEPTVRVAKENLLALERRLLWTREESDITFAAITTAFEDTSRLTRRQDNYFVDKALAFWRFQTAAENRSTLWITLLGLALLVVAFRLIQRRLPATLTWLEMQGGTGARRFFRILSAALRQTQVTFVLALVFGLAPAILGLPWDILGPMLVLFVTPFAFRVARVLLDIFFKPDAPNERLVRADPELVLLLHRAGLFPLWISTILLPVCLLLEFADYGQSNPGFVGLAWLVYKALLHLALIVTLFRPAVIRHLIRGTGVVATSVKTGIVLLYPLVAGSVMALFVLDSLRYAEAARHFRLLLLESAGLLLGVFVVYRLVLRAVLPGREFSRKLSPDDFQDEAAFIETGRERFFNRLTRFGLRAVFFVPTLLLVSRLWPDSIATFGGTPDADAESGVRPLDFVIAAGVTWATFVANNYYRDAMQFVILPASRLDRGLKYTLSTLSSYALVAIGCIIALNILKVKGDQIAWFVSALAVGIGFGLQSIVKNFVSGLILLVERPVEVGDVVTIGDQSGRVENITMRATTVQTWDGIGIVVPNEQMIGGTLINQSFGNPRIRTRLTFGVAYGSDTHLVRKTVLEAVGSHGLVVKRPEPMVLFVGFGDSSLDFEVRYWTNIENKLRVQSDMRFAIEATFRRHDISIPFPQRDLHIKSVDSEVLRSLVATKESEAGATPAADEAAVR